MQTGDLIMFRGTGIVPWIIRLRTKSSWGHCGVLWMNEGVPLVVEALWPDGATAHALKNRVEDSPMIFHTGKSINVPAMLAHLGDYYSVKDALQAGVNMESTHAGWECSEFLATLYGLGSHPKGWTPQRLIEALVP